MQRQLVEKMEMAEELQKILSVQLLQEEVINCRNNDQLLRKIIKQTCNAELKKLQGIEIAIVEQELELPTPKQWPNLGEIEQPRFDLNAMLKDREQTALAMDYLK